MSVSIPSTDIEGTKLNGIVTNIGASITAAGSNGPLVAFHTAAKAQAQLNLVLYLLSSGKLQPATVLSTCTYGS